MDRLEAPVQNTKNHKMMKISIVNIVADGTNLAGVQRMEKHVQNAKERITLPMFV